jgi:hypothetical protein
MNKLKAIQPRQILQPSDANELVNDTVSTEVTT